MSDMISLMKRRQTITFKETVKRMETLGVYRSEFDTVIERYAQMRVQYDTLCEEWAKSGFITTEEYTNKSGATNERKTALYSVIEKLRTDLTDLENTLGLTPKGLQTMKKKGLEQKKKTALGNLLDK